MRLQLSPAEFWALSVGEWNTLLIAAFGADSIAIDAADLQNLMQQYPDKEQ